MTIYHQHRVQKTAQRGLAGDKIGNSGEKSIQTNKAVSISVTAKINPIHRFRSRGYCFLYQVHLNLLNQTDPCIPCQITNYTPSPNMLRSAPGLCICNLVCLKQIFWGSDFSGQWSPATSICYTIKDMKNVIVFRSGTISEWYAHKASASSF